MAQVPSNSCPSNVHILPDDILLEIFKIASRSPSLDFTPPSPLVVSAVCNRWRRLAEDYPLLWTNICIPSYLGCYNDLFFKRSQPAEIDVTLDITQNGAMFYHGSYLQISKLLNESVNRLKSLTIRTLTLDDVQKFSEAFQDVTASVLRRLEVILRFEEEVDSLSDLPYRPIFKDAPCLHFLRIHGIPFDCLPPIVHLTHLDIGNFYPTLKEFQKLLGACSNLTSLVLRQFGNCSPDTGDSESLVIEAPKLQSLAISFDISHPDEGCTCPINYLTVPSLKYLEVSMPLSLSLDLSAHFTSIIKSWPQSSSRTVRLNGVTLTDCLPLLDGLPHESTTIELTQVTEEALPQVLSMPNFKNITLDLFSIPTSTWDSIFPPVVAVSSPVLLLVPPSSCHDPQLVKAMSIHKNISTTISPCDEGMIREENLYEVDSDGVLGLYDDADSDMDDDFDHEFDYDEYNGYSDEEYDVGYEDYDEFEDDGLGVVFL
ncbi:hypothetical protein BDQ17DRAFT_1535832 [Cyathus striatus]|nr:hypothetical protein BDQ17DRAFT_1535832 [Cyathus striatus]